jgi:hypothetical protein
MVAVEGNEPVFVGSLTGVANFFDAGQSEFPDNAILSPSLAQSSTIGYRRHHGTATIVSKRLKERE